MRGTAGSQTLETHLQKILLLVVMYNKSEMLVDMDPSKMIPAADIKGTCDWI